MDFQCLKQKIETIQQKAKINLESITCISSYYKSVLSNGEDTHTKMLGEIKRTISNNLQSSSSIANNFNQFYIYFENYINKCQAVFGKLVSDIILPLDIYLTKLSEVYTENITKLLKIYKEINHGKLFLENAHLTYIQQTYLAKLHEFSSKFDVKNNGDKDKQLKVISMATNSEKIYQYELFRYNKITTNCNNIYLKIIEVLKENEEGRIIFIQTTVNQFSQLFAEYMELIESLKTNILSKFSISIWDQEICKIIQNLDLHCKNNIQTCFNNQEKIITYKEFVNNNELFNLSDLQIQTIKVNEDNQKNIMHLVLNNLLEENEINVALISQLMEVMRNNTDNQKKFLDLILEKKQIFSVKFSNLHNLNHLSNIICYITLSQDNIFEKRFELNFTIVFIAERVYYHNVINITKVYLSAFLSQNKIYRTKSFWINFIELKLANKLNDHIQRVKTFQFSEEDKPSILAKIGNAFSFNFDAQKENKIESTRFYSLLQHYDKLDNDRKEIVNRIVSVEITSLIKECIPNFSNFNFDKALELIIELEEYYQIPKEQISFLKSYYNVSTFTIRRRLPKDNKNFKTINNSHLKLRINTFKFVIVYLSNSDLIQLLFANKTVNQLYSKRIYKQILQHNTLGVKNQLQIWHILLRTRDLKLKYDYHKLIDSIEIQEDKKVKNDIDKDVHRTYVSSFNNGEDKTKLSNILRAIAQCNGTIHYCQGMNYIAQFLLEMTQNEEESFYLFLGLFFHTDYSLIFAKDLHKLRAFFYVFNRLIALYEPEIYSYLLSNSLDVHAFSPSWFITLFVNARPHIKEIGLPKVILRIFDGFLLSGWKAIIKVSINLLHLYENKLMELKSEALLMFVMKDMIRSDFFKSHNVNQFDVFYKQTQIKQKLIENIENEFIQEEKLKN